MTLNLIPDHLKRFTGSGHFYRNPLFPRKVYTEGVEFVAKNGGAYWLIDKIFATTPKDEPFQVWTLTVAENKGHLVVTDGDGNELQEEHIDYTDFPLDTIVLWLVDGTLMLPSEY